ncbi:hypothetical protein AX15_001907 [Amanita polypyramis BW_CC]|nr:hypothetical protein AX15_001907 [Amanita polypyramis BW_CC]
MYNEFCRWSLIIGAPQYVAKRSSYLRTRDHCNSHMAESTRKPLSTLITTIAISTPIDAVPAPKQNRIPNVYLEELAAIWEADKRTPSAASRRAWALARNLNPAKVNNWWYRKKTIARKHGVVLPEETYELSVGIVPPLPQSRPLSSPVLDRETLKPRPRRLRSGQRPTGFVKKEEPQPEDELTLLSGSDDSHFGVNHISSGSSDAVGSLDSDDNKYPVGMWTPNIAQTSFLSSTGCINAEETLAIKAYGAYISSTNALLPHRDPFDYLSRQSGYMLSQHHDSRTGTGLLPRTDVATGQNVQLYYDYNIRLPDQSNNVPTAVSTLQPDFTCALCLPAVPACCATSFSIQNNSDHTQAAQASHEFRSGSEEEVVLGQSWDAEKEDLDTTKPAVLRLTTTKTDMNYTSDLPTYRAMQDPNNSSWCLGGTRYSYDGFSLGLCECSGADAKDGFTFKRYSGCSGLWGAPRHISRLGLDSDNT